MPSTASAATNRNETETNREVGEQKPWYSGGFDSRQSRRTTQPGGCYRGAAIPSSFPVGPEAAVSTSDQ